MIKIEFDSDVLRRASEALRNIPSGIERASELATREALTKLRTQITQAVTSDYYVKSGAVRSAMQIHSDRIIIRGPRRTLRNYKLSPKKAPRKRKLPGYLKVAIRKDSGIKTLSRGFMLEHNDLPVIRIGRGKHASFEGMKILVGPSVAQLSEWSLRRHEEATEGVKENWIKAMRRITNGISAGKIK